MRGICPRGDHHRTKLKAVSTGLSVASSSRVFRDAGLSHDATYGTKR
jgi:hypothetical protein